MYRSRPPFGAVTCPFQLDRWTHSWRVARSTSAHSSAIISPHRRPASPPSRTVSFRDLFAGFSKFRRLFFTWLLYALAVIGSMLLLIVPGIILLIALWPAFLLVMEDDLAPVDAIKGAWALTRGHKMELFVLVLATFVVLMVGLLAFGVGLLIAGPITQLAWIRAYHEMRKAPVGA